jgi:hypothetical protein
MRVTTKHTVLYFFSIIPGKVITTERAYLQQLFGDFPNGEA